MKNDVQKLRSARIPIVGSVSRGIVAIAFLLSSCNLLFLPGMGFEDKAPEFERLEVFDEDIESATLWPTFQATIQDDTGIASVSCSVLIDDGETKSLTIERANERERYVWRVAGSLADVVSAGGNTITFTATDVADNSIEEIEYLSLDAGEGGLRFSIDSTQTPKVASFWHPSGITSVTYHYVDDESNERTLDNTDDGTGDGGDRLFKGTLEAPPDDSYNSAVFTITVNNSLSLTKLLYL